MARALLISGSTRGASSNSALLRTGVVAAPSGVEEVLYDGLAELPHFNPDDDREPLPSAPAGRAQCRRADGLIADEATRAAIADVLRALVT